MFSYGKLIFKTRSYQFYCTNGQTYLKYPLGNGKYPNVEPATFKKFMQSHDIEEMGGVNQTVG